MTLERNRKSYALHAVRRGSLEAGRFWFPWQGTEEKACQFSTPAVFIANAPGDPMRVIEPSPNTQLLAPAVAALLREAARIHNLDAATADAVACSGALQIAGNTVVVTALETRQEDGVIDNDLAIVCPLPGLRIDTISEARLLLSTNLPLLTALGCAFACTHEDEIQLVLATRLESLSAELLAQKIGRMAMVAGAIGGDLALLGEELPVPTPVG